MLPWIQWVTLWFTTWAMYFLACIRLHFKYAELALSYEPVYVQTTVTGSLSYWRKLKNVLKSGSEVTRGFDDLGMFIQNGLQG